MKKGGYDYPLSIVYMLKSMFMPMLVLLLNVIFYVKYPIQCAKSLLFTIAKRGNLSKPTNFRGIQMMPAIACLYDRIFNTRLQLWMMVSAEQTVYQKGKSVLNHLFTLRLLIELTKVWDVTLYIGFFDIAKTFDHVSRYLLLNKLLKMGIGKYMLKALQMMYNATYSIVIVNGKYSREFRTFQEYVKVPPRVLICLFLAFMDDLILHLKTNYTAEILIGDLHSLLHAGNTVLLSTSRESFVNTVYSR